MQGQMQTRMERCEHAKADAKAVWGIAKGELQKEKSIDYNTWE